MEAVYITGLLGTLAYLISNDKVWFSKKKYTSNNDLNNIISCLKDSYEIELICRKSLKKFNYLINTKFNFCKINNIKAKNLNIFMGYSGLDEGGG